MVICLSVTGCPDIRVVIVTDMEMELIHLIPEQYFCIIFDLLYPVRRTGHVQHHAAHLIRRVISRDALRHCVGTV